MLLTVPPTGHVSVGATGGGARGTSEIMRYPIVIHKDPESSYGVTVPDLPGCFSGGEDAALAISSDQAVAARGMDAPLRDVPTGTLRSIFRQAGWERSPWRRRRLWATSKPC